MKTIRFLKRKEIDERKWNELILLSNNSLPYALSWYLDVVAEHWDALIVGNYEAAMPLVWFRKWGIKCVYQPFFCQQLGFFYSGNLNKENLAESLRYVKSNFPYADMNLNPSAEILAEEFPLTKKKNLLLPLSDNYAALRKAYSLNQKRSIVKAEKSGMEFIEADAELFFKFYVKQIRERQASFKPKHARLLQTLISEVMNNKTGRMIAALNKQGAISSAAFLIFHNNRVINIAQASSPSGRNTGAAHFLFDRLIQEYAGSVKVLDFEGSSIPSIARFYEGFGAKPEMFYRFRANILDKAGLSGIKKS